MSSTEIAQTATVMKEPRNECGKIPRSRGKTEESVDHAGAWRQSVKKQRGFDSGDSEDMSILGPFPKIDARE